VVLGGLFGSQPSLRHLSSDSQLAAMTPAEAEWFEHLRMRLYGRLLWQLSPYRSARVHPGTATPLESLAQAIANLSADEQARLAAMLAKGNDGKGGNL